jgi:hypothetical protein
MLVVNNQLLGRMVLAVFGHGVWTAILCAAIWRERGGQGFAVTRGIVIAFCIAVGLHGMWDFSIGQGWLVFNLGDLALPGFDVFVVGPLGLLILGFFLREAVERARSGDALPPPPLDVALKAYFSALWQRVSGGNRPAVGAPQPYPGAPQPYGTQQPRPQPYTPPQPQAPVFPAQPQPQPQPAPYPPAQSPAPTYQPAQPLPTAQAVPPVQYRPPAPPDPTIQMPAALPNVGGMAPVTPPVQPVTPPPPPAFGAAQMHGAPPSETPLPPTVPYCPRCGIAYEPGATFCGQCGSRLGEAISGV